MSSCLITSPASPRAYAVGGSRLEPAAAEHTGTRARPLRAGSRWGPSQRVPSSGHGVQSMAGGGPIVGRRRAPQLQVAAPLARHDRDARCACRRHRQGLRGPGFAACARAFAGAPADRAPPRTSMRLVTHLTRGWRQRRTRSSRPGAWRRQTLSAPAAFRRCGKFQTRSTGALRSRMRSDSTPHRGPAGLSSAPQPCSLLSPHLFCTGMSGASNCALLAPRQPPTEAFLWPPQGA